MTPGTWHALVQEFTLACLYSLCCSLFIFLFWALAGKLLPRLRHSRRFWLAGLVCSLLPVLYFTLPDFIRAGVDWQWGDEAYGFYSQGLMDTNTPAADQVGGASLMASLAALIRQVSPYWFALFVSGVVLKAGILRNNFKRLAAIVHQARPLDKQEELLVQKSLQASLDSRRLKRYGRLDCKLMITESEISPFVQGTLRPLMVIPAFLFQRLSATQLALVIEHEWHHLLRKDPLLVKVAAWLKLVFWFNPFLNRMIKGLMLAMEMDCDRSVLAGRQDLQKDYVGALFLIIGQTLPASYSYDEAGFGSGSLQGMKARLLNIRRPPDAGRKPMTDFCVLLCMLISVNLASFVLQPRLQAAAGPVLSRAQILNEVRAGGLVARGWISSRYGLRLDPFKKSEHAHRGIDYAGPQGDEVFATSQGRVVFAKEEGPYGKLVIIRHDEAVETLYAHLDEISVREGQRISRGGLIGTRGQSGLATGPHVHYEVRLKGEPVCPSLDCL